jgi:hypothetical protein
MRHLFSVTERLSKADVAVLAGRFFDGDSVCIPEFLEFFIATPAVRRAKASAAAVRVALNMLEIVDTAADPKQGNSDVISECGRTTELQAAVRRLAVIWKHVDAPLTLAFDTEIETIDGATDTIAVGAFKVCGSYHLLS